MRNSLTRSNEHEDIRKESEPAKHLRDNIDHKFQWRIMICAHNNSNLRKNLQASFILTKAPILNNQLGTKSLFLFRNGVT